MLKSVKRTDSNVHKYHWFDGSVINIDEMTNADKEQYCIKNNYINTGNSFKTERGMTIASGFMGTFVSLNVFNEFKTDVLDDINETDQWLTGSTNLNESAHIGYLFTSGEDFYLNQCRFIPRLGPSGKVGLTSPSPKVVVIEGTRDINGKEWEAISEPIELNPQGFLEITDIDFGNAVDIPMVGFRLNIISWYNGAEEEMITGLYKVEFICTPATKIKLEDMGVTSKGHYKCIDRIIPTEEITDIDDIDKSSVEINGILQTSTNTIIADDGYVLPSNISADISDISFTSVPNNIINELRCTTDHIDNSITSITSNIGNLENIVSEHTNRIDNLEHDHHRYAPMIEHAEYQLRYIGTTVKDYVDNKNSLLSNMIMDVRKENNSSCLVLTDKSFDDIVLQNYEHVSISLATSSERTFIFKKLRTPSTILIDNTHNSGKVTFKSLMPMVLDGKEYISITFTPESYSVVLENNQIGTFIHILYD